MTPSTDTTPRVESLVPSYYATDRMSSSMVATFNLVATIIGGGILSLPLAFEKCGIALGTALMILAALVTNLSLYLLCLCARYTGATTYGEVGRAAFGPWMECFISFLLFIFLLFVLVAFMVLVRDIWTPIVAMVLAKPQRGDLVLLTIIILTGPFLVQRTLYSLRYNCYLAFCSVSILCLALCHRALQKLESNDDNNEQLQLKWGPSSFGDVLFAFPIITLSFLSSFNILSIQSALIYPTKQRIRKVINVAVLACLTIAVLFGVGGYVYAGVVTQGNILLNCDISDLLFLLGRVGCGTALMLATAIITLPCRDSLLEVIDFMQHSEQNQIDEDAANSHTEVPHETTSLLHPEGQPLQKDLLFQNPWIHYGSTFAIATTCYIGAVTAPGVAVVWSLCGSFMAFLISFILPAACYIRINALQRIPEHHHWIWFSWTLLVLASISAAACSVQTWLALYSGHQ